MLFGMIPLYPLLWLLAVIVFTVVEVATYQLVAVWFAIGAIGGLVAAVCGASGLVQCGVFVALSAITYAATRPVVHKMLHGAKVATNADRLLNQEAVVLQPITPLQKGRVVVDGQDWSAQMKEDCREETAQPGETVRVCSITGVTLVVAPVKAAECVK